VLTFKRVCVRHLFRRDIMQIVWPCGVEFRYVYIRICIHGCLCIHVVNVRVKLCVHNYVYILLYTRIYMQIYKYVYIHVQNIYVFIHHANLQVCAHVYMHTCQVNTYIFCTCSQIIQCVCTCVNTTFSYYVQNPLLPKSSI